MLLLAGKAFGVLWPYLMGALVVFGIWESGHHSGYKAEHSKFESYKAEAVKRTSEIILTQQSIAAKAETEAQEKHNGLLRSFDALKASARVLPRRDAVFPGYSRGLLNSAISAANAAGPTAKPEPETAVAVADSDVGAITDWSLDTIQKYAECSDQVTGWQAFYARLRESTKAP